jgi:hypothetical protein
MQTTWRAIGQVIAEHAKIDGAGEQRDLAVAALRAATDRYFADKEVSRAVLGVDIYQYSRMPNECQRLVPTLFKILHDSAAALCATKETFLFHEAEFAKAFISTGDGGFQILETPLHAVVFAAVFEVNLVGFNGFHLFPALRELLGPISVRYALTYDTLFEQDANFFGPAIINNARILSRDALNRFLLDAHTLEWFQENLITVESLLSLTTDDLRLIPAFQHYDMAMESALFDRNQERQGIKSVHLQKLGAVSAKHTVLDVYSLMLQVALERAGSDQERRGATVVATIGNLNSTGVSL